MRSHASHMYIGYTASEDRSGDQQSVMSDRLAALGSKDEPDIRSKHASMPLIGRQFRFH